MEDTNGLRVAQARQAGSAAWGWTWYRSDHLGSSTVIADKNGNAVRRLAYKAFGEELVTSDTGEQPRYTYTGKERDASGLLYYGARYYDPALARFITPDTVSDQGTQGLNRYAYALNNPIRYTDPTGYAADEWKHWEQELSGNIATHLAKFPVDDLDEAARTRLTDAITLYQAQKLQHKYGALMATARLLPWRQRIYRTLLPLYTRFPANHGLSNENLNALLKGVTAGYTSALADVAGEAAGQMLAASFIRTSETRGSFTNLGTNPVTHNAATFDAYPAGSGFSGVYDVETGKWLAYPSGETRLLGGGTPGNLVARYRGHAVVNDALTEVLGRSSPNRLGFSMVIDEVGNFQLGWNSGMINSVNPNVLDRTVPETMRQAILDAIMNGTGRKAY